MPGPQSWLDDVATDLAYWIDDTASKLALAFAPGRAPFSADITEDQKLGFYRSQLFNADGSVNSQGRTAQIERLGAEEFGRVLKAVTKRWPELRAPEEPEIEVTDEWPTAPPNTGGPGGAPSLPPGPPVPPPMALPPGMPPGPPPVMMPR